MCVRFFFFFCPNETLEKERDRPTQTSTFVTFVRSPFYHFRPSNHLLLLICLLGYVLYGGFIICLTAIKRPPPIRQPVIGVPKLFSV